MEAKELIKKLFEIYNYYNKKYNKAREKILIDPSDFIINKHYNDIIFNGYIKEKLYAYTNLYNTLVYNELIGYLRSDIDNLLRDLMGCPWCYSLNGLDNHRGIVTSNAKIELIKIISRLLYEAGEKYINLCLNWGGNG